MKTRTRRQKEVLEFITRYIEGHGFEPSYQLIARHLGVSSKSGIAKHVKSLEEQGLLTRRRENGSFSLELRRSDPETQTAATIEWLLVPEMDDGWPEEWSREPFTLPKFLIGLREYDKLFAFRVPDNSMSGDGMCEDDIALIELRSFVRDGDRVVAVLNKKQTVLRKYYRAGADIELRTNVDGGESLRLAADRVEIKGVFRGLLRPVV